MTWVHVDAVKSTQVFELANALFAVADSLVEQADWFASLVLKWLMRYDVVNIATSVVDAELSHCLWLPRLFTLTVDVVSRLSHHLVVDLLELSAALRRILGNILSWVPREDLRCDTESLSV